MSPSVRSLAWLASAATACALLTGCGSAEEKPKSETKISTQQKDASLNAKLPAEIRKAGVIKVGTEAQYPPFESLADDNKTIVGLDPDLAAAVGQVLGVKLVYTNIAFDGLLPALDSGRFDMIQAAVTDTKAREEQYDFVDYFMTGQAIVVKKGNPDKIAGIEDLCGRSVAVLKGSTQLKMLQGFNTKECAGKAIEVTALPTDKDALLQLRTGRADATFTQDAVGAYNVKNIGGGNAFEIANSEALLPTPVGMVFTKDDTALRDALKEAIEVVIKSGAYEEILDKYSLGGGAVDAPTVNGAVD